MPIKRRYANELIDWLIGCIYLLVYIKRIKFIRWALNHIWEWRQVNSARGTRFYWDLNLSVANASWRRAEERRVESIDERQRQSRGILSARVGAKKNVTHKLSYARTNIARVSYDFRINTYKLPSTANWTKRLPRRIYTWRSSKSYIKIISNVTCTAANPARNFMRNSIRVRDEGFYASSTFLYLFIRRSCVNRMLEDHIIIF